MHGGHGSVGVGEGPKQLGIGGGVLCDGVGDAEAWDEARGSEWVRPVGNERTSRHDDERPARPRVVLGRFDPQRKQGEAGKQQESCRVLHGGQ